MNRRAAGVLLFLIGLAAIVVGLLLMLVIVPGMKQFPDDVDTTRNYEGTMPVLLNAEALQFLTDIPVELVRHFKTEATDGDLALVLEEQTLSSQGTPLLEMTKHHAIDRKTMEFVNDYPASWGDKEGLIERSGLVLGWPLDAEKKDYVGWSDDYRATVPLTFAGEEEHDRAKIKTYHYTSSSEPQPIDPDAVAAMGLPTELSHAQLGQMIGGLDINPMVAAALPTLIGQANWPDPVPLTYVYGYEADYWVEPATGVLIDTRKVEIRSVGFSDELMGSLVERISALGLVDPALVEQFLPVTVFHLDYKATDQSVQDAKQDALDAKDRIALFGTTIPYIAIAAGIVLALLGLVLALRR
ncbi:MAG: DUF3068 domain-containing protein [Anaerolineae bacterium]|nr:DUF3068 domain-containing protein [Anaerolineae bacterium]